MNNNIFFVCLLILIVFLIFNSKSTEHLTNSRIVDYKTGKYSKTAFKSLGKAIKGLSKNSEQLKVQCYDICKKSSGCKGFTIRPSSGFCWPVNNLTKTQKDSYTDSYILL